MPELESTHDQFGDNVRLYDFAGSAEFVIVDASAPWCAPCSDIASWLSGGPDPYRARLLIREMLDRPAELTALFRTHLQPLTALVTEYVRQGQVEGRIRAAVDPEAFVVHLVNAVIAATAGTASPHLVADAPDEERLLAELFRIVRTSLFNERPS